MHILGLDIGGTKTRLGIVQYEKIIESMEMPTPQLTAGAFFQMLKGEAHKLKNFSKVQQVAVGIAGTVHQDILIAAPNLPHLVNAPIKNLATLAFGHPARVLNDVQAAALCEWHLFHKPQSLWAVFLGTGLGSGLIINDRLWSGASGSAGEIGYFLEKGDKTENFVNAKYIHEKTGLAAKELSQKAKNGDGEVINFWHGYGRRLGGAISYGLLLNNPEIVVFGGGITRGGFQFFEAGLWERLKEDLPDWALPKIISLARGGEDSVLLGASLLAS